MAKNKVGVKLMRAQVMKEGALKDLLMLGGKEVHYMDKIMPFNITAIMKLMENIY